MTTIVVKEGFKVVFDGYNWEPYVWTESTMIEKGKYKGQMSKAALKPSEHYFMSLSQAVRWIIDTSLEEEDEYTLEEYIKAFRKEARHIESIINKALLVDV